MALGNNYDLCTQLIANAKQRGLTIGTAESCTGGMVCAALTDVPGSSAVVMGGVVSYAIPVKEALLGVPAAITQDSAVGVVSSECAAHMSEGARRALGCDIAVATTGIAGPGGEEPGKPVGTVWFGISGPHGTTTQVIHFDGERAQVREQAVEHALALLIDAVDRA